MPDSDADKLRVTVDGKFFRLGESKFHVKGVTYGPFAPNTNGEHLPGEGQVAEDLSQMVELEANTLRVYHTPPKWFLDLVEECGLKVLVDVAWWKTGCFLDQLDTRNEARKAVRDAVKAVGDHPAVFAFSVVNEIAPDVVRWHGVERLGRFIDELADIAHEVNPDCLVTFGNYPPTEYLTARNIDFVSFNVYLHERPALRSYVSHLQMLADAKPLVMTEIGIDSKAEGAAAQAVMLDWQLETICRGGAAGTVVFSFTDEWFKDGEDITGWEFGLVDRNRNAKPAYESVKRAFSFAPYHPLKSAPRVSVVVATYNGSKTLRGCLHSLKKLNYPDYEVIVVDDGSVDSVPDIAQSVEGIRYIRQDNMGLSVARNTGMNAATGEIVAYTDDDCRADEDWLYYLAGDLAGSDFVAMGGHNFLPTDDGLTAAAVMAAPGGPIHVMLTETEAEHIPGCNMAFRKTALEEIGGFDPIYTKAGDDVDVCWRLMNTGHRIGFNPAGFVWHYRRSTVKAYLKQQMGYGEAEALLERKHPDQFNPLGGGKWHGRIYAPAAWFAMSEGRIYRGAFGEGMFQTIYSDGMDGRWAVHTSLERQLFVTLPLLLAALVWGHPVVVLGAVAAIGSWIGICAFAGANSPIDPSKLRWWSRPLVSCLYLLQPLYRGWARYSERFIVQQASLNSRESLDTLALKKEKSTFEHVAYWSEEPQPRAELLEGLLQRLDQDGWRAHRDAGWGMHDLRLNGSRWCHLLVSTASEWHKGGRVMLRCRMDTESSLLAKVLMFYALVSVVLVAGLPIETAWKWCFVYAVPIGLILWLRNRRQTLRRIFSVILDQEAAKAGWQTVGGKSMAQPSEPAAARPVNNAKSTPCQPPVYAPEWFSIWNSSSTF